MADSILQERALEYARLCDITLNLERPLGFGSDGSVWASNRDSAVKAFSRLRNYRSEVECYQRLMDAGVEKIDEFTVPRLLGTTMICSSLKSRSSSRRI